MLEGAREDEAALGPTAFPLLSPSESDATVTAPCADKGARTTVLRSMILSWSVEDAQ